MRPQVKRPRRGLSSYKPEITAGLRELTNRTNAAVLIVRRLELTRFRGHPIVGAERKVHDAEEPHPPYSPEFRQRIVELVRKGRTPEELARQFEPSAQAIRNWMKQAALDAGERADGLTTEERDELRRLRREVRQLREERAILSKAAAWFARETNTIPSKDSSS